VPRLRVEAGYRDEKRKAGYMRALVSGGGTAGHVYPALAVARVLAHDGRDAVAFVGAPDSLEQRLATEAGLAFVPVRVSGWDRARPLSLLTGAFTTTVSVFRCVRLLRRERTDVVIGFGGYVSLPLGLAAALSRVPLVLHEQNAVPGVANRVLARWARAICLTYDSSAGTLRNPNRAVVTGNPVRESVLEADGVRGRAAFGIGADDLLLLVFGGSRGARHLNEALINLYARLREVGHLRIVQIAGPKEAETVRDALDRRAGQVPGWWRVEEYVDGMGDLIAAADLVVCRSGATTLAELSAIGRASVLVPYPYATDDHQTRNADPFVEAGAADVIADARLDGPEFERMVTSLLADPPRRAIMAAAARHLGHPNAAQAVAEAARAAAGGTRASDHDTRG
jgi:UDP-N-acetylglucosamine--N-acetylmuramyl-(pentapeptide) pyrophosphoryl-undecaprenol N-acetylglucosamine transferase